MEEPLKQRSKSMEMISTFFFPISLFFLFLAIKLMNSKLRLKKGSREAPGPWNLPFLGSLHHLIGSKLPHRVFRDLSAVYGPVMSLKFGEINAVVLSSAEAAREVMKTHDIAFATHPISVAIDAIFYGGNSIVFGPYGEFWRTMRRICTMELLSAKRADMLLAGSETTATILEWTMSELVLNPNIMKKAQKEVRDALGSINMTGKVVDEEALSGRLTYLSLVIKEAFRLHPPGPLLLPRENQETKKVMGYEIPAKTNVVINMWAIARDARYWVDPNTFWPERFEESSLDFRGAHFEFTPFGAGRRICPGMQFGLAVVEIVLAYLLYYFDWEFLGEKLDMTEAFGTTTRRESPLCVVPTLRFPLPGST